MNAIELSAVGKCYGGHWAVRDLSLRLAPGERLALLGHNGAGKTTMMKLILGLTQPDSGAIQVFGAAPGGGDIGFLPENVVFHDAMTGSETLRFYARLKRRSKAECETLLERVGLTDAAGRRVGTYSKGMRQRLGLAQALLGSPKLLLLDEPTTGLDPALRQVFYEIIAERAASGTAILLSSHLLTEVEERTDRIVIMNQGRQVISGSLADLRGQAGLPVEIRLRVAETHRQAVSMVLTVFKPVPVGPGGLVIRCRPADKVAALRLITGCDAILDVDISQPGLDAIYAHFTGVSPATQEAA